MTAGWDRSHVMPECFCRASRLTIESATDRVCGFPLKARGNDRYRHRIKSDGEHSTKPATRAFQPLPSICPCPWRSHGGPLGVNRWQPPPHIISISRFLMVASGLKSRPCESLTRNLFRPLKRASGVRSFTCECAISNSLNFSSCRTGVRSVTEE